jgi:hypothetical protein
MGAFKDKYITDRERINDLLADGWVYNDEDLDYDNPVEDDDKYQENCFYTEVDEDIMVEGIINERLLKKIVVRAGKKLKKWYSDSALKKVIIDPVTGRAKEVIKKVKEKIARKKGARKAKIKRSVKKSQSNLKRRLSKMKRSMFGIKTAKRR